MFVQILLYKVCTDSLVQGLYRFSCTMFIQIVLYREDAVLSCECEMPFVHSLLSRIPDDLPFELLITRTGDLFIQYPPHALEAEARHQYEQ